MANPVTSVVFQPDAPLGLLRHKLKTVTIEQDSAVYLNCTEVNETSYGFLQLIPVEEENTPVIALYVPPGYVMYMLRHERPGQLGFV